MAAQLLLGPFFTLMVFASALSCHFGEQDVYSFLVGIFHSPLHAGLSRRTQQAKALIQLSLRLDESIGTEKRHVARNDSGLMQWGKPSDADTETI
jgi:hypothetical protein